MEISKFSMLILLLDALPLVDFALLQAVLGRRDSSLVFNQVSMQLITSMDPCPGFTITSTLHLIGRVLGQMIMMLSSSQ